MIWYRDFIAFVANKTILTHLSSPEWQTSLWAQTWLGICFFWRTYHSLLFLCHFQTGFSNWCCHNCSHHFHTLHWTGIPQKLWSLCLKILLCGLRQHRTNVTLVRITFNHFLANSVCHRGHLCIKELVVCHTSLPLTFPQVCDSDASSAPGSVSGLQLTRVCGHCTWLLRWAQWLSDVQVISSAVSAQDGYS